MLKMNIKTLIIAYIHVHVQCSYMSTHRLFIDMMLNERATSKVRVKLDLMAEVSDNVNSY